MNGGVARSRASPWTVTPPASDTPSTTTIGASPDYVSRNEQGELFPVWCHHAVFTDSPLPMLTAESGHRRRAIIEQVIANLKSGPMACRLPS